MAVHWGGRGPGHMSRSIGGQVFDYYVDPASGSDANPGTLALPLAKLSRANTLIGASTGKRVGLKRGTTLRNDPVSFGSANTYVGAYGSGVHEVQRIPTKGPAYVSVIAAGSTGDIQFTPGSGL